MHTDESLRKQKVGKDSIRFGLASMFDLLLMALVICTHGCITFKNHGLQIVLTISED